MTTLTHTHFHTLTVTPRHTVRLPADWTAAEDKIVAALVLITLFAFYNLGRRKFPCLLSLSTGHPSLPWSQRSHEQPRGCMCMTAECRGEGVKGDTRRFQEKQGAKIYSKCTTGQRAINVLSSVWMKKAGRLQQQRTGRTKHQPLLQSAGFKAGK